MSLIVPMPDDIRTHDTKILGPFTKRDLICACIGLVYTVPLVALLPLSLDNRFLVLIICIIPPILCARVKVKGLNFEVFALKLLYLNYLTPRKRKYRSVNRYRAYLDREERKRVNQMSKSERKRYENKTLTPSSKHPIYK